MGILATELHACLARKLGGRNRLSGDDILAIESLPLRERHLKAGTLIVDENQIVSELCLLIEGFACRSKVTRGGSRQIVSFHVAGDILDIQHLFFAQADHNVQLISDAKVAFIPMEPLREIVRSRPEVATALWRDALVDASIFREWVLNVGRRPAPVRVSHMLCEFATKCETAGVHTASGLVLPMTQDHIADAAGLTSVHVNRVLRVLRELELIAGSGRAFRIADWAGLQRFAEFRPNYLHLAA